MTLRSIAPFAVFGFAALFFAALTISYWSERRRRRSKSALFPLFTLVCAAAFVTNQLPAGVAREVAAGLLPPLILHLTLEPEWHWLPFRRAWGIGLGALYVLAGASAIWPVALPYPAAAAMLAVCAAGGLIGPALSGRPLSGAERAHRNWLRATLFLMTLCAATSLAGWGVLVGQTPDYLVLAFFAVTLYYRERLVFFDVLVKGGAFLAVGMAALMLLLTMAPAEEWVYGAVALGFWVGGAALYPILVRAIDRRWLRRAYAAADAERQFLAVTQGAADEEDLAHRAAATLSAIFQAPAKICWDAVATAPEDGLSAGPVVLEPRADGVPFLSDDRRLAASLANALGVIRQNVRYRAGEQRLRLLATRAELKALRAQINPHFLFNSLSVIAGLIPDQPALADETIEQLAQVFRYTLRKSEVEWTPLGEEVEFAVAYLRVEQARFGERLQTRFAVDAEAASIPVPSMCVQPLIENAVKHGVSAAPGPGRVTLSASIAGAELRIEVTDTGPGFPPGFTLQGGEAHGLRNVADRLRGYYGDAARLSWDRCAEGTRVMLSIPQIAGSAAA